ncbi:TonB-dependent siderophore receptor [Pseudoalteromonas luteoviolacea]|uniref:TonB-denpendent receptor n=1 Tax=Pseudoalteromonas luteoviolacea S4054 TaxID=1129367 RepID=A0A0F6AAK9_9GAMM|nr:TonB-dependent siderophore receptor [Pseudoalteromonas luteoviolacea]AOT07653.1 TonB-dependent receptor [Pseudoalteromonas luteoviolacea]AOT12569.1 TonB-dependent receptor [Pseudoalteromonas luteoviolacea]AOT17483.1 TonB-dependent receptor [Pseudoalteromonas luteoviolacea]KKE82419.1 TonB-denpendent receptor [Pseudoalteromonas luteoviolacea S4054]KZN66316.1 TonB-denpendent receptor [Pseudoalteromonas luteoviolacea S4047-1]
MKPLNYACRLSVLSLSLAAIFSAQAQNSMETIEVKGERQAYRGEFVHLETPESIFEFDAKLIENTGLTDLTDVLDMSASVSRQNSLGGLWDSYAIRGFFGDENVPSNYLVNGFNAGRGFSGPRDVSGIERVEVLKGPKAALYGRGEPGGSINLVTKKASFEDASSVQLTAGNRAHRRFEADINAVISDDVAGRFIGFYQEEDSFRDTIETQKQGIMASLVFDQSERSRISYDLEYAEHEIPFDRGIIAIGGNFDFMPIERFLGEPGDGPTTTSVLGHQLQWTYDLNDTWELSSAVAYRQTELDSISSDAEIAPQFQKFYLDGQTLARQHRERRYDTDQYVVRFEVAGEFETGSITHNIIAGIDYDRFEYDRAYLVARGAPLATNPSDQDMYAINVHNPVYGQVTAGKRLPAIVRQQNQWATGIYIQNQIELTDALQVRIGGRFDSMKQTLDDKVKNFETDQSETRFSPQLGVVYQIANNWSVYSTYGEGYRLNFGADVKGNTFDPNETDSLEFGSKWSLLDNNLDITLAYFDSEQKNIIVVDTISGGQSAIGKASSAGYELDIAGQLPADIEVRFSYMYLDAQVEEDYVDTGIYAPIKKGDDLLNIPENSASLQISQDYLISGNALTIGAGLQYVDERLGQRGSDFYLPSYVTANLFANYDINDQWAVKAQVHNAFDRTHFTNSYTQFWVQPGEPRKVLLSTSYKF